MTDDTIVKLAREAGHPYPQADADLLERFAELVAADEREACAKVCDLAWHSAGTTPLHCAEAIRARGAAPKGGES